MIYLIGGAPRAGKSTLAQRVGQQVGAGWVSTDLLVDLLRAAGTQGVKTAWNAAPEAIRADAEWFYSYLERFVWGAGALAEHYVIEGVDFLPEHVRRLATQFDIRAVFLGNSGLTLADFADFPGRSKGYSGLPEALRRQMAQDVPAWSAFVRQECEQHGCLYVDTAGHFAARLHEAEVLLTGRK